MAFLLGNNVVADTDESGNMANANIALSKQFTAVADGNADEAIVNLRSTGRNVAVMVYDISENLLCQGTISSSVDGDNTVSLSPTVAITNGATYRLAILPDALTGWRGTGGTQNWDTMAATYPTVPDPYVDGGNQSQTTNPRFFVQSAATTYTITSIDGDNDVQAGQPNVDIIMTATTGVTSVTLGGEALTINGVT